MSSRELLLNQDHEYLAARQDTVANVLTPLFEFRPPVGAFFGMARKPRLVVKLVDGGGAQVPGLTKIFIGKKRPGDNNIQWLPGFAPYHSFHDLSTVQQRNVENREMVMPDFGGALALREEESLIVGILGPTAVDHDNAGTVFELPVGYQNN